MKIKGYGLENLKEDGRVLYELASELVIEGVELGMDGYDLASDVVREKVNVARESAYAQSLNRRVNTAMGSKPVMMTRFILESEVLPIIERVGSAGRAKFERVRSKILDGMDIE